MRRWIRYAAGLALVTPFMVVAGVVPARAGGGFCHDAPVTDTSTDRVVISNYCFGPTIARVGVGDGEAAASSQAGVPVALPDVPSTGEAVAPAANDEGIREVASFPWKVGTVVGFSLFILMVVAVGLSRRSASRITGDPNVKSSLS